MKPTTTETVSDALTAMTNAAIAMLADLQRKIDACDDPKTRTKAQRLLDNARKEIAKIGRVTKAKKK